MPACAKATKVRIINARRRPVLHLRFINSVKGAESVNYNLADRKANFAGGNKSLNIPSVIRKQRQVVRLTNVGNRSVKSGPCGKVRLRAGGA